MAGVGVGWGVGCLSHTCSVILIVMSTTQLIYGNQLLTHLAIHNHPCVCLADVKVRSQKNSIFYHIYSISLQTLQ